MGRRLGQHFLRSGSTVSRILEACRLAPDDVVVEIGPGRGVLTRPLLARARLVAAVELDRRLAERLRAELGSSPNFRLVEGDFLSLGRSDLPDASLKLVGNLPYNVGTAIIRRFLRWPGWSLAVVMVQKEVADRLLAGPGGRTYGSLSVERALLADAEPVVDVPPSAFRPPPKVRSSVLRLTPRTPPEGVDAVLTVVHAAFRQRRKKILNSLATALGLDKARAEAALREAGIDPGARAERVPVEAFVRLSRHFVQS